MRAALLAATLAAVPIAAAGTPASAAPTPARVVIVAVPDLRWIDVETMPRLQAWAITASVGELSTKTSTGTPRCADGNLTFSAGDRANAPHEFVGCTMTPSEFQAARTDNMSGKFAAAPGAFGQALEDAGLTRAAAGTDAAPLLADASGRVPVTDFKTALTSADVVAVVDSQMYDAPPQARPQAAKAFDDVLADQLQMIPHNTLVMVAGISDGAFTRMHLHVLLVGGPGWRHVALRSPSTRPPYVQLRDLAPTVLSELHVPIPAAMIGRPAYDSGAGVRSASAYADDDDHAVTARDVGQSIRAVFAYAAVVLLGLLVFAGRRRVVSRAAIVLGTVAVGAPVCSFLVQVLPWWHWPSWAYGVLVGAGALVVAAGCLLARRRNTALAFALGPAVTAVILILDQLTGAHLQLSAPLGDNPIVAGRFHGMGNTDFALMCTSVLICAGIAAGALRAAGRRRAGLILAAALCFVALVVDAVPMIGDDFGGVLAMGPSAVVLVALLAGVRPTWRRAILVAIGTVVLAVGVALIDYSRPADKQTHIGRFVGDILHGGARHTLDRKIDASLLSFKNVALSILVGVLILVVMAARQHVVATLRRVDGLTEAAAALVVLAVLGTFLNDSGVVVGGTVILLTVFAAGASALIPAGDDGSGGSPL